MIKADLTVTLGLTKRGLALEPGRSSAGQVEIVDIGIPQAIVEEMVPACWSPTRCRGRA